MHCVQPQCSQNGTLHLSKSKVSVAVKLHRITTESPIIWPEHCIERKQKAENGEGRNK